MSVIVNKNLLDLALRQELIGAIIHLEDGVKTVEEMIEYDSMTHTFTLKFTNGDIQELSDKLRFPIEVAAASATGHESEITHTASAFPKLKEWPTVPEEVHMETGLSLFFILRPILRLKGEEPAKIPTTAGSFVFKKTSPPFSTITSSENSRSPKPTI